MAQDQSLVTLVMSRQSMLETDKSNFNDRMQDVADYVAPHRDDILGTNLKGEAQGTKIYDGTAVGAAVLATDGIHGYHVSPAFAWFKYTMNRKQANENVEVKKWLNEVEHNMYMALNRSNFYAEMWPYIYDGFTLGTSSIYATEDLAAERIMFETIHPGEIYIAENQYGEVDVLHRKKKITARKLDQMFGKEKLPVTVQQAVEKSPFVEFEVIHAVFPREEYDDRMKDAKNKKYASVWILKEGNVELRVSGFDSFPFHVWRYLKTGKYPYGTSPSHLAMADIKGLNLMNKTLQGAAQLAVDGSYNVPSYLEGKVQLRPRGLNYIKNPRDAITPINTGSNFPVGIDREQVKQEQIRERFHVDKFLLLTQLAGQPGDKTATEVTAIEAEKMAILGAELGPFNNQLEDILGRVYQIETDAGRMPDPPEILEVMAEEDDGLRFDPVFQGVLAQSQRQRFGKDPIRKFLLDLEPIIAIDEEVLDNYNWDEAARILGNINNIPGEMENSRAEVSQIRQGRSIAQQEEEQQEQLEQGLEGVKTFSEIDKNLGGKGEELIGGTGGLA